MRKESRQLRKTKRICRNLLIVIAMSVIGALLALKFGELINYYQDRPIKTSIPTIRLIEDQQ